MAEGLSSAPVLSTPDTHILTEIEPRPTLCSSSELPEEQFKIHYEIERTIEEIRRQKWRRVALQFPDQMLPDAARVFQLLARGLNAESSSSQAQVQLESLSLADRITPLSTNPDQGLVKLTILADTSYGSCCADEIAAEHVDAEAVVHYGRACLSPTARLPVLYIFTKHQLDYSAVTRAFEDTFPDRAAKVLLTADIPYASHIEPISSLLNKARFSNVFGATIVHDPSCIVPNRRLPQPLLDNPGELSEWHLYHISEPPTALLLALSSKLQGVHIYSPNISDPSGDGRVQQANTSVILRRRYALVTSMNTVSTWGILINTLSVKNYLHVVEHVKKEIAAAGKKSYLFVVGKLNAAKVANFSEIGGWVVIGCWESSLIDSKDFFRPILTPFELELALAPDHTRIWTGAWRSDFQSVLDSAADKSRAVDGGDDADRSDKTDIGGEIDLDSDEESAPPEFDLRTGRYVARTRPMGRSSNQSRRGTAVADTASGALTLRSKGDLVAVNGVASPAAEYLSQKRTWQGLGSDFEIRYEEDEVEGRPLEEGRTGLARGYTIGESVVS